MYILLGIQGRRSCTLAACYIRAVTVIYSHNEGESPTENKTHGGYRP